MGATSVIVKLTFGNFYFGDRVYENLVPWYNNKKKTWVFVRCPHRHHQLPFFSPRAIVGFLETTILLLPLYLVNI